VETPGIRYARSGEYHIAYQVVGDAPRDLLFVTPTPFEIEVLWDHPRVRRLFERLCAFSRLIVMNRRGLGLSDPVPEPATLEEQVADVIAVLDAVGSLEAVLYAEGDGAAMGVMFAAAHPRRVSHLILPNGFVRAVGDRAFGLGDGEDSQRLNPELWLEHWGEGIYARYAAPDISASDPTFVRWWARMERAGASPGTAAKLLRHFRRIDVRAILPDVRVPTLVIAREGGPPPFSAAQARYIAERVPGARLEIVPGRDTMLPAEGMEGIVDLIEEFVTGERKRLDQPTRSLTTVVFTDVVGSTELAARLGDSRWRELLAELTELTKHGLSARGGRLVKSTGDGHLALFEGPAAALRATATLATAAGEQLGIDLRGGIHTGEVERIGDDVAGIAVHVAARIADLAGPGEVRVSSTVRDLIAGSGIALEELGEHSLKGVPEPWRLFRLADGAAPPG
jgi:class 3 adenylate cyclase